MCTLAAGFKVLLPYGTLDSFRDEALRIFIIIIIIVIIIVVVVVIVVTVVVIIIVVVVVINVVDDLVSLN